MYKFSYWDNSKGWHTILLFSCIAKSILEADSMFYAETKINVIKSTFVGCVIKKIDT